MAWFRCSVMVNSPLRGKILFLVLCSFGVLFVNACVLSENTSAENRQSEKLADLVAPPGYYLKLDKRNSSSKRGNACRQVPKPFTGVLSFPSKYEGSDSSRDKLNVDAAARYANTTKHIKDFEKGVVKYTAAYLKHGREFDSYCALMWMEEWAAAHSLENESTSHTGKSMRKWALGSVASAYLSLKTVGSAAFKNSPDKRREIENWFSRLADQVVVEWGNEPIKGINNHEYWAAWSVLATAVVLNRRDLFDWSVAMYETAESQIDEDGYLPNELKRKTRALAYHNYALVPLAMTAAFIEANGVDLHEDNDFPLERLANRVILGIQNPDIFTKKTGKIQISDDIQDDADYIWLEPYCSIQNCDKVFLDILRAKRPMKATRLGGNVTQLFEKNIIEL